MNMKEAVLTSNPESLVITFLYSLKGLWLYLCWY